MPGTSTEQVVDKGIRQKSIHSFHSIHSFTDSSAFCPGAPKRVSLGLRETPACIHVIQHLSQPRVACWHGFRQNSPKTECVFTRCPTGGQKKIACIYGLRSEGVKGLVTRTQNWTFVIWLNHHDSRLRLDTDDLDSRLKTPGLKTQTQVPTTC